MKAILDKLPEYLKAVTPATAGLAIGVVVLIIGISTHDDSTKAVGLTLLAGGPLAGAAVAVVPNEPKSRVRKGETVVEPNGKRRRQVSSEKDPGVV